MQANQEESVKGDKVHQPPGQIDCALIRHAQAQLNRKIEDGKRENKIDHEKTEEFWRDPSYIDNALTEVGILQCFEAKKHVSNQIQVVFVSPLERALQTANLIFSDRKDIKIIVRPNLTEIFKRIVGISKSIADKKQRYPNMDFTAFTNRQIDWQTDLLSQQNASGACKLLTEDRKKSEQLITDYYFNLVKNTYPATLQDRELHRKRVLNELQQIRDICHGNKYTNIAIVTHNKNIKHLNEHILGQEKNKPGTGQVIQLKI